MAAALVFTGYNLWDERRADAAANAVLEQMLPQIPTVNNDVGQIPDYKLNPKMNMPEKEIDGYKYIGVLKIPQIDVNLPVISSWSDDASTIALCRYGGSAYLDNMIIAGHNYATFFRNLKNLQIGDDVIFTDIDGNVFRYAVADMEILSPSDTQQMKSGDWPLTLFTCTVGGQSRVTVRCEYVK